MAERHNVEGFDAYISKVESLKQANQDKTILAMFSGGKNESTGKSWCPDCVHAEPVVNAVLDSALAKDSIYIYCSVGDRTFWKDPNCIFRKDPRTLLKSIPTLIKIDGNAPNTRLVEGQCQNRSMIEMMFEDWFNYPGHNSMGSVVTVVNLYHLYLVGDFLYK